MRQYTLSAAAKINLYLEVVGDRPDGYHELVMVMQSVNLADQVTLRSLSTPEFRLQCDHPQVPTDASNLALKAANLLKRQFPNSIKQYGGAEITLQKNIPVGAGLAGGSTDAAAVLVGIDLLWHLGLSQPELQTLGAEIGSDVPFCITGGTAIATGRGDQVDSLYGIDSLYAVLAKYTHLSVSTPWAYKAYREQFADIYLDINADSKTRQEALRSSPMVGVISRQDGSGIGQYLHNDLEKVVLPTHTQVQALKDVMHQSGGLGTLMSGSGPTVFALAETQAQAEAIAVQVRSQMADAKLELWVTQFSQTGVQIIA
jgi:4-diphosphocytidyl-2-C-methyl-D-erythritol kinase